MKLESRAVKEKMTSTVSKLYQELKGVKEEMVINIKSVQEMREVKA